MVTDTVANATNNNIFSLVTKKSRLVTTLVTIFLYDLDPSNLDVCFNFTLLIIKRVKLKQTFHLILLCFHRKKCVKSHNQSQFTSNFIPTSVSDTVKYPK